MVMHDHVVLTERRRDWVFDTFVHTFKPTNVLQTNMYLYEELLLLLRF